MIGISFYSSDRVSCQQGGEKKGEGKGEGMGGDEDEVRVGMRMR